MIKLRCLWIFPLCLSLLLLGACEKQKAPSPVAKETVKTTELQPVRASAELKPTEGSAVVGTITFTSEDGGVRVVAVVEGLVPGLHGFHVHEVGDCSAPDASSAGGHFNPHGAPHGGPEVPPGERHVGDLGNLEADANGVAKYERLDQLLALTGPDSIVGKAVIVHAKADDLGTQPAGDAGPRLACGVIQQSN